MKKRLFKVLPFTLVLGLACLLVFPLASMASDPAGVVNVNATGNNGSVTITTVAPYVQDVLTLATTGTFSVNQSNRFVSTGQWNGDGNDIDRSAVFVGAGSVSTVTNYLSTDAWALGMANLNASVTASGVGATGTIAQNMTFDPNNGGVYTQSQGSKQRTMDVYAGGNYTLDVSNVGASIAPSLGSMPSGSLPAYSLDINAVAVSGNAGLHFTPVIGGSQALSNNGDHSQYTGSSANFVLAYVGAPVVAVGVVDVQGGSISIINNFLNSTVSGSGAIK